jgi:hypothetical protein
MPDIDQTALFSALMGCGAGYAAIKVEIKFLWRDVRELKEQVKELIKKAA